MAKKFDRLDRLYFDKNKRMAFEAGYYRGTIEAARKPQEKKEAENGC